MKVFTKGGALLFFLTMLVLLPYSSAGFFDFFKRVGKAPSETTDVSITVSSAIPAIPTVQQIPDVSLISSTTTNVIFTFDATDPNGVGDLNDASAFARFTRTGEPNRIGACTLQSTGPSSKTYQCTVGMQYYDDDGAWGVTVNITDASGNLAVNNTRTFFVNILRDITITPTAFGFPTVAPGAVNVLSSQNTTVRNNGNYNGSLAVTAVNLIGQTNPGENIPASNFRISGNNGAGTVCTTGTILSHNVSATVINSNLLRTPPGTNESLRYCLTSVPTLSSQVYSTGTGQKWRIAPL